MIPKGFKFSEESKKKMSESHKGQIPWNKGKIGRYSKETREKMSLAKKGKTAWNKGRKCDWVTKRNLENNCMKNKEIVEKAMMNRAKNWNMTKVKISCSKQGINIKDWNGFKDALARRLRNSSKWKIVREVAFIRDNFTCKNINCEYCDNKIGVVLHPHHIKPVCKYPELVFNLSNVITYCENYHIKSDLHKELMQMEA